MNINCSVTELLFILEAIKGQSSALNKAKDQADIGTSDYIKICNDIQAFKELKSKLDDLLSPNDSNPMNY